MNVYSYLVTITNRAGEVIESSILNSKEGDPYQALWNIRLIIDPTYEVNLEYLGPYRKPRKLIPVPVGNL